MDVNGNHIELRDTGGDGPPLLFVHGILADHTVWRNQVRSFGGDHRVVCMDLRGFGMSTTRDPEIGFEDHAADIAAVIDGLGLRDVTLVGWSMGGAIAQVMGPTPPDALRRIVMVDTTPQLLADEAFPHAIPPEAAQQLGALMVEDYAAGCAAFAGLVAPEDEAVAADLAAIAQATRPEVGLAAFASSGARDQLYELTRIEIETHVICGAEDGVCPPAASEYIAATVPGCTTPVATIEGAGHAPFLTRPEAFDAALRRALGG